MIFITCLWVELISVTIPQIKAIAPYSPAVVLKRF